MPLGEMDFFTLLDRDTIEDLRRDFVLAESGNQEGIDIYTFVRTLLKYWPTDNLESFIGYLIDLFEIIDVDSSGLVSWEEFLDFCVEAGEYSTRARCVPFNFIYRQKPDFVDEVTSFHDLAVLKFIPEISYLLLVEDKSRIVKFLGKGCKCAFEICPQDEFRKRENRERHSISQRRHRLSSTDPAKLIRYQPEAQVLCLEYVTSHRQMVISTLDGNISFWDVDVVHGRVEYNSRIYHEVRMHGLCHSKFLDMLFSWSYDRNDFFLYGWEYASKKLKYRINGHENTLKCAMEISRHAMLVTGAMDGQVIFWDLKESRQRSTMPGLHPMSNNVPPAVITTVGKRYHKRGIRAMAFSPEHEVLISVGFDVNGYAWDTNSFLMQLKLVGHRSPLLSVKIVKHETERALTCDVEGSLRLWAIERSVGSKAICLALFDAHTVMSTVRPRNLVVIWNNGVVLSSNGLYYLESIREKRKDAPLSVRFSESRSEFFVMMSKTAYVVDAITGKLKRHFNNLMYYDITDCVVDSTCTKVFTADASGSTGVHRTINLNRIADSTVDSHDGEINGLVYIEEDNLLVTVGADRKIHVYEGELGDPFFGFDGNKVHKTELLRSVAEAHEREITFVAFSYGLSLIATASSDLTIRVWDYQRLSLESAIVDNNREITSVGFLSNYPIVLAGDVTGRFRGWLIRPAATNDTRAIFNTHNTWSRRSFTDDELRDTTLPWDNLDLEHSETMTYPITIMAVNDIPEEGVLEVFTGDEWGGIKRWDFSDLVKRCNLKPVNLPASQGKTYNPRQNILRKNPYDGISRCKEMFLKKVIDFRSTSKFGASESSSYPTDYDGSQTPLRSPCSPAGCTFWGERTDSRQSRQTTSSPVPERRDAVAMGKLVKMVTGWEGHQGPIVAMEILYNPRAVATASADKSVKVFSWEGQLLGIILTDFGWYKERYPWIFTYDKGPSDQKLKVEVDKVLDGLDKSAVATRKKSMEVDTADQTMSSIMGAEDGEPLVPDAPAAPETPVHTAHPPTILASDNAALQALIDMCLEKRASQRSPTNDQLPRTTEDEYVMTRRPSQREKYPSLRAEKDKQHIRFRPQANQDEALITAYIKERKDEQRRLATMTSDNRRPSSASEALAQWVLGNGVLIQSRKALANATKFNFDEVVERERPKTQAQRNREEAHAKMNKIIMSTQLAEMPTNASLFGHVTKSDKFLRCQDYLQRLENGELDEREQLYQNFVGRLKDIMTRHRRKCINDKELAAQMEYHMQPQTGAKRNNHRVRKRRLKDIAKNFQRERISAQTLDMKNIGRFGPYSVRDVMDFITFFDYFDKTRSGDLSVGSLLLAPTYTNHHKQFKHLFEALGVNDSTSNNSHDGSNSGLEGEEDEDDEDRQKSLHGRLIPMAEVLRKVFRYCKYEELRRIKNFVEISRMAEALFQDSGGPAQRSLPPLVEHDLLSTFYNMEKWHCGTITVRELCDILSFRGVLPPWYSVNDMEREGLNVTACDSNKELEAKEIVQLLTFFLSRRFTLYPPTSTTRPCSVR